jgi:antitoxin MazE
MLRKLFKTGNSVVVSLPGEILDSMGLTEGDEVSLDLDHNTAKLTLSPVRKTSYVAGINPEFAHQVNEFIERYRPALEELAR